MQFQLVRPLVPGSERCQHCLSSLLSALGAGKTNLSRLCHQEETEFLRCFQDSGNLVVHSVCRDFADALSQFGVRSGPRAAHAGWRRAACVFFDTASGESPGLTHHNGGSGLDGDSYFLVKTKLLD